MAHSARPVAAIFAAAASLAVLAPERAHAAFDFTSATPNNQSSITFTDGAINLTVDNPVTAYTGSGGVNTASAGLCAWLQNSPSGSTGKRCNYTVGPTADGATLTGLSFTFDKKVRLKSFLVSMLSGINSGGISFTQGAKTVAFTNITSTGIQTFSSFSVEANTPLLLTTTGDLARATSSSGTFRIDQLQVEEVPGPLPMLGAAAAFGWGRRLRRRTIGTGTQA